MSYYYGNYYGGLGYGLGGFGGFACTWRVFWGFFPCEQFWGEVYIFFSGLSNPKRPRL